MEPKLNGQVERKIERPDEPPAARQWPSRPFKEVTHDRLLPYLYCCTDGTNTTQRRRRSVLLGQMLADSLLQPRAAGLRYSLLDAGAHLRRGRSPPDGL